MREPSYLSLGPRHPNRLLTVRDVANRLNVSLSMVYALVNNNKLRAHRIERCVRISELALDEYLAQHAEGR